MQLSDFLDFEAIRVDLSAGNKRLAGSDCPDCRRSAGARSLDHCRLHRRAGAPRFDRLRRGVAIPHGKLDRLDRVYALVTRLAARSIIRPSTASRSTSYSLLLSPPDAGAEHLKALAAVSRLVRHGGIVEKLRGARTRDAMAAVLIGAEERDAA